MNARLLSVIVTIFVLVTQAFSVTGGTPQPPQNFYGSFTINGVAAPIGTAIRGYINGEDRTVNPPYSTIVVGQYGSLPASDNKFKISGTMDDFDATITFMVETAPGSNVFVTADQTSTFDPAADTQLDLTVTAPPEICTDGVDNDGDGKTDCADTKCAGQIGPGQVTCCQNNDNCNSMDTSCADGVCSSHVCTQTFKPAATDCRAATGACDVVEKCTGSSATCPADGVKSNSNQCRAVAGVCDAAEFCDGSTKNCPTDVFLSVATQCRVSAGQCDVAEYCTGQAATCPADGFQANGFSCDDGLWCNTGETCQSGVCSGGAARNCADAVGCTDDSCNEGTDLCVHSPNNGICISQHDSGWYCDINSGCLQGKVCTVNADCADSNVCTDDVCVAGICQNNANTASCEDGNLCTLGDVCSQKACVAGAPKDCSDSKECTTDSCVAGVCQNDNKPQGTSCGSIRDCNADQCFDYFWYDFPADGHDTCDASGNCQTYQCIPPQSTCNMQCGAECETEGDCEDGSICLNDCSCSETSEYCIEITNMRLLDASHNPIASVILGHFYNIEVTNANVCDAGITSMQIVQIMNPQETPLNIGTVTSTIAAHGSSTITVGFTMSPSAAAGSYSAEAFNWNHWSSQVGWKAYSLDKQLIFSVV
jgi:hypothetical protein